MKYVDILCVGGPMDGTRTTTDYDYFQSKALNSFGGNMPPRRMSGYYSVTYELVALDMKAIKVMFFKPVDLSMEDALIKIMDGYNPRDKRRY